MALGAMSIMQRESSAGSHIPTSTTELPMRSVTSPALLPTPMESGQHQPPSLLPQVRDELVHQHGLFYKRQWRMWNVYLLCLMEGILKIYSSRLVILCPPAAEKQGTM